MQDRQLYQQILGITAPWHVERVELRLSEGEVHVYLGHDPQANWVCPECQAECPLHDHDSERLWRHLDTCQYRTILHAASPRVRCVEHGVRVVRLPWAEPHSRFTALFERLAIDWLEAASQRAVKEQAMKLWDFTYPQAARNHFAWWYRWATHSRLKPMIEKAKMLKSHLQNILTYLKHGITNATSESIHAKIQWVKYTARGFRNLDNLKNAVYFHCGDLDLLPRPT